MVSSKVQGGKGDLIRGKEDLTGDRGLEDSRSLEEDTLAETEYKDHNGSLPDITRSKDDYSSPPHFAPFCQAQPQLQLQLWLRLALILISPHHPTP